ncbi:hypothetical protein [Aeromicrobium sp. UC242_57]|uniref:hypothetical protein n=1 Tax=Aeromicrobium sp. UC242_57 TaxID=3374624 RepID=UPI003794C424
MTVPPADTVNPAIPTVEAAKDITPSSITAGQSAKATITGTNGAVPVSTLRLADLDFFTDEVTFGGFSPAPVWPAGADTAEVIYHLSAGGTQTVPFTNGATPTAPSGPITGFEIIWSGDTISADETATVKFDIDTSEEATGADTDVTLTNTVAADVEAPNGLTDEATAFDTLRIVNPDISVTINKAVRPSSSVEPGETVISSLAANAVATGDGAVVHDIVVDDVWGEGAAEFWNAFDFKAVAPTQVPPNTELTIEVRGRRWHLADAQGLTGRTVPRSCR